MTNQTNLNTNEATVVTLADKFAAAGVTVIQPLTAGQIELQERVSIVIGARGHYVMAATFITDEVDAKNNQGGLPEPADLLPFLEDDLTPTAEVVLSRGNDACLKATIAAIEVHFNAEYDEKSGTYKRPEDIMSLPKLTVYTNSNISSTLHNGFFKDWIRQGEKFNGTKVRDLEMELWARLADLYMTYYYAVDIMANSKLFIPVDKKSGRRVQTSENAKVLEAVISEMWATLPKPEDQEEVEEEEAGPRVRTRA